ncbi:MAG: hypothetical protein KIS61_11425 [Candidatus Eremiobacteraeota bacterium]|nr:hypothetical protein [Candidatus Eremiobacteraeota bacterium]
MRWLLLVLLLGLTLPAAAMFDFLDHSPNQQYPVTRGGDRLILEHGQEVLWSRPLGFETDQGLVCLHQAELQTFLDRQGKELLTAPNSEGWFAADGSRYFGHFPDTPELQQLKLVPGSSYQPVDAATLKSQAPTQEVLCELASICPPTVCRQG